jgi:hypothetical protein
MWVAEICNAISIKNGYSKSRRSEVWAAAVFSRYVLLFLVLPSYSSMTVVPAAFAFRFSLPVVRSESLPKRGKRLLDLGDQHRLLWPGSSFEANGNATIKAAWNAMGIGFQIEVSGKKHPPVSNPDRPKDTDGIQIWLDTRNTQTIHRANRFCHHFCVLPNGAGQGDKKGGTSAIVKQLPVARALEDAPIAESPAFKVDSRLQDDGYCIEVWFDASQLNGFDPESSPRLGFFVLLHDSELGNQSFTVDEAFPFPSDPSIWQTLELSDG